MQSIHTASMKVAFLDLVRQGKGLGVRFVGSRFRVRLKLESLGLRM